MQIDLVPALIDQYRETFEGQVGPEWCWITDGRPDSGVFGTIASLSARQAFAPPPGRADGKPIAAHVEHLRFSLDLTHQRLQGENPPADWQASFNIPAASPQAWESLQQELRRAYETVLGFLQERRQLPVNEWPPIHVAGLVAMTAHNAYHLGAIRQIAHAIDQAPRPAGR